MKGHNQIDIKVKTVVWTFNERHELPWSYDSLNRKPFPDNMYEISYLKQGSYITTRANKKTIITANSLIFSKRTPKIGFVNKSKKLPDFFYSIVFLCDSDLNFDFFKDEFILIHPEHSDQIEKMFIKGIDAFIKKTLTWQMDLTAITTHILSIVINTYFDTKKSMAIPYKFNNVISYIYEHIYIENISIKDLAEMVNLSTEHFIRSFKIYFGMSPKKYINKIKLNHAIELLRNNDNSISDIASLSGFNDPAYFSRIFKEEYKMSPTEYKNKIT